MSTTFPTSIQSFTAHIDQSSSDLIDAADINDVQDTVAALEAKVGADSSAVTSSIDYKLSNRGAIGYAEITSNQGSITTETDVTSLSVTVTVPVGGRRIKISAEAYGQSTSVGQFGVAIKEGATQLQSDSVYLEATATNRKTHACVVLTPSSGSHTYKVTAQFSAGTGTVVAGATFPAYILVESI